MPNGFPLPRTLAAVLACAALTIAPRTALCDPIYVAITGSDFSAGTQAAPVRTIEHAITLAAGSSQPVYIGEGVYAETVQLASGVSLYGGFVPTDGWSRDPAGHPTTIDGGATAVIGDGDNAVALDGLVIHSSKAGPAQSSIGVFLKSCIHVSILNCRVEADTAGAGTDGSAGTAGGSGNNGHQGAPGCENGAFLCSTCSTPQGGSGGTSSFGSVGGRGGNAGLGPAAGLNGASGSGSSPGAGGFGVPSQYASTGDYTTFVGQPGTPGSPGANGTAGAAFGSIDASGYLPASGTTGSPGSNGSGGGGGGGGGGGTNSCDSYGSSGGGGGSGGERGLGGGAGGGGGGSFGILLSGCDEITVQGCTIVTASGGAGGACGAAGPGGSGGTGGAAGAYGGGNEQDDGAFGARGGDGGKGGNGGAGGGGGGGPTFGVVNSGPSPVSVAGNSFIIGSPGLGGAGAVPGAAGAGGQLYGPSAVAAVTDPRSGGTIQLASAPNPFSRATRVDYVLATESRVSLTVHDLQGARVATLADGVVPAGRYVVTWDGRVNAGGAAPAGVYFVRLTVGGGLHPESRLLKIVRTK